MNTKKEAIRALAHEAALLPQEEMLEVGKRHERLIPILQSWGKGAHSVWDRVMMETRARFARDAETQR